MRSPRAARLALGLPAPRRADDRTDRDDRAARLLRRLPFLAHWVELLPPYNEHLVTDVGGLYLGFAVIFAWAARTLERTLVLAACVAWLLTATIHLVFHATHLGDFYTGDAVAEIASLTLLLVPAPVAIWGTSEPAPPSSVGP